MLEVQRQDTDRNPSRPGPHPRKHATLRAEMHGKPGQPVAINSSTGLFSPRIQRQFDFGLPIRGIDKTFAAALFAARALVLTKWGRRGIGTGGHSGTWPISGPFPSSGKPVMEYQDRVLKCIDCGADFIFTAGEQVFFYDKKFTNDPKRCKQCKAKRASGGARVRPETRTSCSACGTDTTVPFKPTQGRPVLCRSCFQKQQVTPRPTPGPSPGPSPGPTLGPG
jgi:CxxC-x17-CxxC domain-containing protein